MLPTARQRTPARRVRLLLVALTTAAAVAAAGSVTAATAAPTTTARTRPHPLPPLPVPRTVVLNGAAIAAARARPGRPCFPAGLAALGCC